MKKYLNEKGSLPLILLMVFVISITIISLSNLLMTEKVNTKLSLMTDIHKMYEKDSVIEVTENILKQQLLSKEWDEIAGEETFGAVDLSTVEETLNQEILPELGIESQVFLEEVYYPPNVDYYCQEVNDDEGNFLIYDCINEYISLELKLTVAKENSSQDFFLTLDGLKLLVTDSGDSVYATIAPK